MTLGVVLSFVDEFSKPLGELQKSVGGITKKFKDTRLDTLSKDIQEIENKINSQNRLKLKLQDQLKGATSEADKLNRKIRELETRQRELNSKKISLEKNFKNGKISADKFNKEIKRVESSINSLNNKKLKIKNELDSVKSKADKTATNIKRVESAVSKLNSKKLNLKEQFEATKREIESANSKLNNFSLKVAKISAISAATGKMALNKISSFVEAYKDIQQAQGDIASLGIDESGIEKITKTAIKMSNTYSGMVAPEIIKASYDIKSGIASLSSDGVAYYTKLAATTAKATISTTKEMTKLFALTHDIFKGKDENDIEFGERVSSSIAQAVKSFRTDGSDLVQGISNIGATAHAMGVSLEQELAIIGVAKGAFSSASEAGTGYRAFLAGAVGAQKELGISLTDTKGKLLPMVQVLEQIKKKYGKAINAKDATVMAKLKKAFGSDEAVKMITALINKTDELKTSEQELLDAKLKNVEAMAKARNRGGEFTRMMQRLSNLSATIGKVISPAFDFIANSIGEAAIKIKDFIEGSKIGKWVVISITAIAGLAVVLGIVGLAVSAFTSLVALSGKGLLFFGITSKTTAVAITFFKGILSGFTGVLQFVAFAARFAAGAFLTLIELLLFNPIGLAITAIAVGAYLVIRYWSQISSFFVSLWNDIVSIFNSGTNLIINLFTHPIKTISSIWTNLGTWFDSFWQYLGDVFSSGSTNIANIFTSPIEWIKKMWGKLLSWLGKKISSLKGLVNSVASFIGYGKVFDVDVNAKGDIGATTGYKLGDKNTKTIKTLEDISKNTKHLHKIAQGAQKVTPAPLKINSKKNKRVHGTSSKSKRHYASKNTKESTSTSTTRGSSGRDYNINITLNGTDESLIVKLQSVLPTIIKDLEAEKIGRAYYDL